jgi:peptidoglycan/LPS O-acetylase OafA/YrhL
MGLHAVVRESGSRPRWRECAFTASIVQILTVCTTTFSEPVDENRTNTIIERGSGADPVGDDRARPTPPGHGRGAAVPAGLGYERALDGLRAVAVLCVVGCHTGVRCVLGGAFGVDLFFVLSGFLITSLLLDEFACSRRIDLKAFYVRRLLRLAPASLTLALLYGVLVSWRAAILVVFELANWSVAFNWHPLGPLTHCWSLSLEEQFYLGWPLMMVGLSRLGRRGASLTVIGLILACVLWRTWLSTIGAPPNRLYSGFDTRVDAILVGCLLGFNRVSLDQKAATGRFRAWVALIFGAVPFVYAAFTSCARRAYFLLKPTRLESSVMYTALALGGGLLLIAIRSAHLGVLRAALSHRLAVWIGRRSYGIYLWHFPIIYYSGSSSMAIRWISRLHLRTGVVIGVDLLATVATAAFSYRVIEAPFLRFKRRFERACRASTSSTSR